MDRQDKLTPAQEPSPEDQTPPQEQTPQVKYATPMQRIWAWVGVVYVVILMLLTTYAIATADYIRGIGGFMLSPALCGLGASTILRYRQGIGRGGLGVCIALSAACFGLAVWNTIAAVPVIAGQLFG